MNDLAAAQHAKLVEILMKANGGLSGAESMYEDEAKHYADAIISAGFRRGPVWW